MRAFFKELLSSVLNYPDRFLGARFFGIFVSSPTQRLRIWSWRIQFYSSNVNDCKISFPICILVWRVCVCVCVFFFFFGFFWGVIKISKAYYHIKLDVSKSCQS